MWADMNCLGDLWTGAIRSKIPSKWQAVLACLKRSMEQRKSGLPQWQDWAQKLPVSLASSAPLRYLPECWSPVFNGVISEVQRNTEEEGLPVRIWRKGLSWQFSSVREWGQRSATSQRNIWSIWGGVSLNPKDWVNNTSSNEANIQV